MKIVKNRPFRRKVIVKLPSADGEGFEEHSFTGHFVALTTEQTAEHQINTGAGREAFLAAVFKGFEGIEDDTAEGGLPMPITEENLTALIKDPFIQPGLVQAYFAAVAGVARKN